MAANNSKLNHANAPVANPVSGASSRLIVVMNPQGVSRQNGSDQPMRCPIHGDN